MCDCLIVSRSGYYAWRQRKPSTRTQRHHALLKLIQTSFNKSHQTYGYPRVHADLTHQGITVGRHQIAGIMRHHGIMAKMKRKMSGSARMKRYYNNQADRIGRCPSPGIHSTVWVGDITQINTQQKPFFLAAVMNRSSRRLIGVAMSEDRTSSLTCRALQAAIKTCPTQPAGLFHSDQGTEYAAYRYRRLLTKNNMVRSISRRGNCYDNAHMESFFHSLKTEMVYFQNFESAEVGMKKVKAYIQYYNECRRHSSLGYLSPVQFESMVN